jgi:hypothetical protein
MIDNKIRTIFDDIFEDKLDKRNYLVYYKFIYDITSKDNTYEIELIKNSLMINYQKLCIKNCEILNKYENQDFLDKYYDLHNQTKKNNDTCSKIFSYFLKNCKEINIYKVLEEHWGVFVVKPNLEKITKLYTEKLDANNIYEIEKITSNFKNSIDVCYYTILNELYVKYVNNAIKSFSKNINVNEIVNFFSMINRLNTLYSKNTISKVENDICINLIKNNIGNINDSLKKQHDLLLTCIEEIAITNFNVFPKFSAHIDLVNEYHKIVQKYDNKFFTEKLIELFDSFYSDKIFAILKKFDIKIIVTYIDFIDTLYDNLNIQYDFLKGFTKDDLKLLHTRNIRRLNLTNDFIVILIRYINKNITDNINNLDQLSILVNAIDNKELFGEMYKKSVVKRLVTPKKVNLEHENLYFNNIISKCEIDSASRVFRILDDYKKSIQNTKEFTYINNINSTVINATFDMWDIKENIHNFVNKDFADMYKDFKSKYQDYYNCRYENRNLKWCDNLSSCVVNFNGNELLCTLKQADILSLFNETDAIDIETHDFDNNALNSLIRSKILYQQGNLININNKVKIPKSLNIIKFLKSVEPKKKENLNNVKNKLLWNKETYIESYIMRHLKKEGKSRKDDMFNLTFKKYENYQITNEFFEKIVCKLEEQNYIKINNDELFYIP